ncbi:MAG TPA: hypothetical protein DDY20_05415 [Desulfobulbaceae bacterium]|nr:hypothetical protein [Desulfobulbaceae bacterium]
MPRRISPLIDTKVKTVKPTEKPLKLFDGWGLYLPGHPYRRQTLESQNRIDGKKNLVIFSRLSLSAGF